MGSTICTAGFPSAAIASSCFTARCDSIWYGFFIATLLFSAKENSLSAYQGCERGVATFYDLTGIPLAALMFFYASIKIFPLQMPYPPLEKLVEPFGNFSPMSVLWFSVGSAPAYEISTGCAELLGGLLLILPRTT